MKVAEKTFGDLKVIKVKGTSGNIVLCKCKCGKEIEVKKYDLTSGMVKNCGCFPFENVVKIGKFKGNIRFLNLKKGKTNAIFKIFYTLEGNIFISYKDLFENLEIDLTPEMEKYIENKFIVEEGNENGKLLSFVGAERVIKHGKDKELVSKFINNIFSVSVKPKRNDYAMELQESLKVISELKARVGIYNIELQKKNQEITDLQHAIENSSEDLELLEIAKILKEKSKERRRIKNLYELSNKINNFIDKKIDNNNLKILYNSCVETIKSQDVCIEQKIYFNKSEDLAEQLKKIQDKFK